MADDLGYSDIHVFSGGDINTPNLDVLVASGWILTVSITLAVLLRIYAFDADLGTITISSAKARWVCPPTSAKVCPATKAI